MGSMLEEALKTAGPVEAALTPPRGLRDFLPSEQAARQRVMDKLRETFERYGFLPLETPALENWEVLSSKYAGGSEILKETYGLMDQGDRRLGLRYDLTVPLCRVVAGNPGLAKPFKRYQIAPVWRDGPIRVGRYREFIQCDVDTVGAPVGLADAEILALASETYSALGLDVILRVNNRKLLWGLLETALVPEDKRADAMLSLDKLEKIGKEGVVKELQEERNLPLESINALVGILTELKRAKTEEETFSALEQKLAGNATALEGLRELREVFSLVSKFDAKLRESIKFDPLLARGLTYYTGPVFEAYLKNDVVGRAVGGGGRYDELVGIFAGSSEKVPAVGFSFGLDVLMDAIRLQKGEGADSAPSTIKVFIMPIGPEPRDKCLEFAQQLRKAGVNTGMDLLGRGPSKNLESASKQKIPYCLLVGKQELEQNKVKLKDMNKGEEKLLSLEEAIAILTSKA